jgi:hypothetical protein
MLTKGRIESPEKKSGTIAPVAYLSDYRSTCETPLPINTAYIFQANGFLGISSRKQGEKG